jgi:hypothetical protein
MVTIITIKRFVNRELHIHFYQLNILVYLHLRVYPWLWQVRVAYWVDSPRIARNTEAIVAGLLGDILPLNLPNNQLN